MNVNLSQTADNLKWLHEVKEIVFSGGGVKIVSMCGAWFVLDQLLSQTQNQSQQSQQSPQPILKSWRQQIKHVYGTSGGGFLALLVCLGLDAQQMYQIVCDLPYEFLVRSLDWTKCMKKWGILDTSILRRITSGVLVTFIQKVDCTFQELYERTGCLLSVAVTVVNTNRVEYHNALVTPNYPVVRSIVASMSIPFLFQPTIVKGTDGLDYYWVDGGLIDNVPFHSCHLDKCLIMYCCSQQTRDIPNWKEYTYRLLMMAPNFLQQQQLDQLPVSIHKRKLCLYTYDLSTLPITDMLNHHQRPKLLRYLILLGVVQSFIFLLVSSLLE